jgi:hypothetical protein
MKNLAYWMNRHRMMKSAFGRMHYYATCTDMYISPYRLLAAIREFDKLYVEWKLKVEETQGFKI